MDAHREIKRVFVAGTSDSAKAMPFADTAASVGRGLAEHGFDLVTGPGTGISQAVIAGFRSVASNGLIRVYLPRPEAMASVGEEIAGEFDEVIQTSFDYPMRNVYHIMHSDALIVIAGGDGTIEESLPALTHYHIPTIVFRNSGKAASALQWLSYNLFPEWMKYLSFVESPDAALRILTDCRSPAVIFGTF